MRTYTCARCYLFYKPHADSYFDRVGVCLISNPVHVTACHAYTSPSGSTLSGQCRPCEHRVDGSGDGGSATPGVEQFDG